MVRRPRMSEHIRRDRLDDMRSFLREHRSDAVWNKGHHEGLKEAIGYVNEDLLKAGIDISYSTQRCEDEEPERPTAELIAIDGGKPPLN